MKDIVRTSSGLLWQEVETVDEAMRIGRITQTAFGHFFRGDVQPVGKNRYFALGEDAKVIGSVPLWPSADPKKGRPGLGHPLFVGFMNGNPFPEYAAEIQELAVAVSVEISPEHYPYRGAPSEDIEEPSP